MAASRQRTSKKFQDRGVIIDDEHPWPAGLVRAEVVSGGRRSIPNTWISIWWLQREGRPHLSPPQAGRQAGRHPRRCTCTKEAGALVRRSVAQLVVPRRRSCQQFFQQIFRRSLLARPLRGL